MVLHSLGKLTAWGGTMILPSSAIMAVGRRYIGGLTLEEGMQTVDAQISQGRKIIVNVLVEHAHTKEDVTNNIRKNEDLITAVAERGYANKAKSLQQRPILAVKPTAIWVPGVTNLYNALGDLAKTAEQAGIDIDLDAEEDHFRGFTLDNHFNLWDKGIDNVGVVLQARNYRTPEDHKKIVEYAKRLDNQHRRKIRERHCLGIYRPARAVGTKNDRLAKRILIDNVTASLNDGLYVAIATHDWGVVNTLHDEILLRMDKSRFENQVLLGVPNGEDILDWVINARREVGTVYVPIQMAHGEGYPYITRRVIESPNLAVMAAKTMLFHK